MAHEHTLHIHTGEDEDKPEDPPKHKSGIGRRKINIEFIEDKGRRHITFSKRKAGIMKKAYELSTLTGTQVLLLVASETGHVYTFSTPKLQPMITKPEGKNLIQACLNSPDSISTPAPSRITFPEMPNPNNSIVPFQTHDIHEGITGIEDFGKEDKERRHRSTPDKPFSTSIEPSPNHPSPVPPSLTYPGGYHHPNVGNLIPHPSFPSQQSMYPPHIHPIPHSRYLPPSTTTTSVTSSTSVSSSSSPSVSPSPQFAPPHSHHPHSLPPPNPHPHSHPHPHPHPPPHHLSPHHHPHPPHSPHSPHSSHPHSNPHPHPHPHSSPYGGPGGSFAMPVLANQFPPGFPFWNSANPPIEKIVETTESVASSATASSTSHAT